MMRSLASAAVLTALIASTGAATPVYNTSTGIVFDSNGQFSGSRSLNDGNLVAGGTYNNATRNPTVSWLISLNPDGKTATYQYVFTGFKGRGTDGPDISHVILDLTDDGVLPVINRIPNDPEIVTGTKYNGTLTALTNLDFGTFGPGPGEPGFPLGQEIVGVKFNGAPNAVGTPPSLTISFTSNRLPVWGNFYLKGGPSSFAYNTGLANPSSANILDFIARPNGVIPEPSSLALCGTAALAGLGLGVRRFRRRG